MCKLTSASLRAVSLWACISLSRSSRGPAADSSPSDTFAWRSLDRMGWRREWRIQGKGETGANRLEWKEIKKQTGTGAIMKVWGDIYNKNQSENRVWEAQHDRFVLQHPLIHTSAAARYCLYTHTCTHAHSRTSLHALLPASAPQRLIWLLSECDPSTCLGTINVLFHPPLGSGSALHHPPARTLPSLSPSPPCQPGKTALTSPLELSAGQKKKKWYRHIQYAQVASFLRLYGLCNSAMVLFLCLSVFIFSYFYPPHIKLLFPMWNMQNVLYFACEQCLFGAKDKFNNGDNKVYRIVSCHYSMKRWVNCLVSRNLFIWWIFFLLINKIYEAIKP